MKNNICKQQLRKHEASYIAIPELCSWFNTNNNTDRPGANIKT